MEKGFALAPVWLVWVMTSGESEVPEVLEMPWMASVTLVACVWQKTETWTSQQDSECSGPGCITHVCQVFPAMDAAKALK